VVRGRLGLRAAFSPVRPNPRCWSRDAGPRVLAGPSSPPAVWINRKAFPVLSASNIFAEHGLKSAPPGRVRPSSARPDPGRGHFQKINKKSTFQGRSPIRAFPDKYLVRVSLLLIPNFHKEYTMPGYGALPFTSFPHILPTYQNKLCSIWVTDVFLLLQRKFSLLHKVLPQFQSNF